jgi:hypothetical protein
MEMTSVERYRRMANELLELAGSTQDSDLADVFRKLADQYAKLAEADEHIDRADRD